MAATIRYKDIANYDRILGLLVESQHHLIQFNTIPIKPKLLK